MTQGLVLAAAVAVAFVTSAAEQPVPRVGTAPGTHKPGQYPPPKTDAKGKPIDARDLAATSPDPAMRRYLASVLAKQADAHSFVLMMLLADDGDTSVRQAALEAAYNTRCKLEIDTLCNALIAAFIRDTERDIAWQARDWLLERDMDLALEDADKAYKLDLLAKLGGAPTIPAGPSRRLLRCLSADADTDVQDNAAWLLEQQP